MICIFCENTLSSETKPEHILLNALGGRKVTQRATCSSCNNIFGSTIDKSIADQVPALRNMFQLHSGTGGAPPGIRKARSANGPLDLKPDGSPDLRAKPFKIEPRGNGVSEVSINLRSFDELPRMVPNIAAALKISEEQLWGRLDGAVGRYVAAPAPPIHVTLSMGGEDAIRSMVKSCLALLATVVGTAPLREEPFFSARQFVVEGGRFNESHCSVDNRCLPESIERAFVEKHGPIFNLIYVKSNGDGRVVGYFHLYNVFSWQMVLAERDGPVGIEAIVVSNPENPAVWTDELSEETTIEFEWLNQPNCADGLEFTRGRLGAALDHYVSDGRAKEIRRIIESVFGKYYREGELIEEGEKSRRAIVEVSTRITHLVMGVPYEEAVTVVRPPDTSSK